MFSGFRVHKLREQFTRPAALFEEVCRGDLLMGTDLRLHALLIPAASTLLDSGDMYAQLR